MEIKEFLFTTIFFSFSVSMLIALNYNLGIFNFSLSYSSVSWHILVRTCEKRARGEKKK
jgi:hypothetical protein